MVNLFSTYTCCLRFYALKTPIWLFLFSFPLYHFSETCSVQSGLLRYLRTTRMVKMAGKDIQPTDDSNEFSLVKEVLITVSKHIKLCGMR